MARLAAYVSLLFLAGCAGSGLTRVPKSDPTPPAAALEVNGTSAPMRLAVGGESRQVELRGGDSLVLTAMAEDQGGVKDMSLQGNARVTCSDPATGASFTKTTGFLRKHVPGAAMPGRVPARRDSRFVLRPGDLARVCGGARVDSAIGLARVQAANYHGIAAATPQLEFRIAMGEASTQAIPMPSFPLTSAGASRAGTATGFAPEAGAGGSGPSAPAAAPLPRMCPRSAAPGPGRAAETRNPPAEDECSDPPVPSMSPPMGHQSPAHRKAPAGKAALRAAAQRSQIRPI